MLELMGQVAKTHRPVTITKHGKPVMRLTPVSAGSHRLFGYMKGTVELTARIVSARTEEWSAESGDEDDLYAIPRSRRQ